MKAPKSHKEIFNRSRVSERRSIEQIKDDIFKVVGVLEKHKKYKLEILLHELDETSNYEGASNPYC